MKGRIKLAIVGSRSIEDGSILNRYGMGMLEIQGFKLEDIETIISGGARGVDFMASKFAYYAAIPFECFPAKWKDSKGRFNYHAGFERNAKIVEACDCGLVIWDGFSGGTEDALTKFIDYNKPYILIKTRGIPIRSKDKKTTDKSDLWTGAIHTVAEEIYIGNPLAWEKLYEKRTKAIEKEEPYSRTKRTVRPSSERSETIK